MYRALLINALISIFKYKNYLEIGVGRGDNFKDIEIENKECCDPNDDDADGNYSDITYEMTSDKMFESINEDKTWDIIFIDGYHEGNQVMRDLFNSMKHLSSNGIILIHDSLPDNENDASYPRNTDKTWNGTVYKIYPRLKDLQAFFFIINEDSGIGVIPKQEFPDEIPEASTLEYNEIFNGVKVFDELNIINNNSIETILLLLVNLKIS